MTFKFCTVKKNKYKNSLKFKKIPCALAYYLIFCVCALVLLQKLSAICYTLEILPMIISSNNIFKFFTFILKKFLYLLSGHRTDYLNVAIRDGCLSLTMGLANGKQEMQIRPNKVRFDDNQWHKVSVHRRIQEVG